jgi:Xaa-Pro aminopeptidase
VKARVSIPDKEYQERIAAAARMAVEEKLHILIVHSNDSDFANVRYFSNFWPLFETAGVAITPEGHAALLVGPESVQFAADRSKIAKVFPMLEYREAADPAYPEFKACSYKEVFKSLGVTGRKLRIGIGGWLLTNLVQMAGLRQAFPEAEFVRADDLMVRLRSTKSENELACMREGYRIAELATQAVMKQLKPGMTELELVGVAQKCIYENGAEYEGLPMYIFSEASTRHAISRSTYRQIRKGDLVQLNLSARVDGYSPSVGLPVSMGKLKGRKREVVEFALEAHRWTHKRLTAGALASDIAKDYITYFRKRGFGDNYLYGPCHGTGMIEVEAPWMESISNYLLRPNMTFQVDTFVSCEKFGVRWETGVVIKQTGCSLLSKPVGEIYELDV